MSVIDLDTGLEVLAASRIGALEGVAVAVAETADSRAGLMPGEAAYAAGVSEQRAKEFAAGRRVARAALQRMGLPAAEIGSSGRRPAWPAGAVGSIAHTGALAAAAVGSSRRFRGLGLDLESETAVSPRVAGRVLSADERAWLPAAEWRTMLFCAKEAVYKAVNPIIGEFLGFQDVELDVDAQQGGFRATCRGAKRSAPAIAAGRGCWARYRAHWLVLFAIPAQVNAAGYAARERGRVSDSARAASAPAAIAPAASLAARLG